MDWSRLPYFLAAARAGSLRAAAEQIAATHATVDRNIRALEDDYGVRLFERSKGGLVLTEAGRLLVPHAEEAERALVAARRRLQGQDSELSGTVRLSLPTAMAWIVVPEILARFEQAFPDIELDIAVTNQFADINRSETDVSLRIANSVDDDVVGRKLFTYASGTFASCDYLDRHWESAGPQGQGLTWVGWDDPDPLPAWVRASPFPKARVRYRLRDPSLIMNLVEAGMGMSMLPFFAVAHLNDVAQVPGTEPFWDRSLWLLLHSDLKNTARVRALVDFLSAELRALRPMFQGPMA